MKSLRRRRHRSRDVERIPLFSVRPWGLVGFCCVALSLALAALVGYRWLTILFSVLGISITGYGAWRWRINNRPRDKTWFACSGTLGGLIILLICFAPGVINDDWAMDGTISKPDPNELTVVPKDKGLQKGRALVKDEALDTETDAYRQDDILIRIESAKIGQVPRKGETPYLLVRFRLVNLSQVDSFTFYGFHENQPVITDESGRTLAFIEQRLKQIKNRTEVFEEWRGGQSMQIGTRASQDVLLIFESPSGGDSLILEANSAAWGRKGVCRFRLEGISPAKPR
jgi:hypothetical protein